MEITDEEYAAAAARGAEIYRQSHATAARYDREARRVVIELHNGLKVSVPSEFVQELVGASDDDLGEIELCGGGLGIHWPRLDADLYVPSLLQGSFGTRAWMASLLGRVSGEARAPASRVSFARTAAGGVELRAELATGEPSALSGLRGHAGRGLSTDEIMALTREEPDEGQPMRHEDFTIGQEFETDTGTWRCTDVGTRTIVAIRVSDYDDPSWFNGPPYAVVETVFDEDDMEGETCWRTRSPGGPALADLEARRDDDAT